MRVSVIICTWNRARLLDQTLDSLRQLRVPADVAWEVLVVNNNCTDDTDTVLERHQGRLPLRRILETRQGLSHARNAAVAAARGDLLVWTDDDVLVDRDWLASYVRAAHRWPEAAYFGGPIEPWFAATPPDWAVANLTALQGMLVVRDFGAVEGPLPPGQYPFGANMAFRREVFVGRSFDPSLGRMAYQPLLGEETAFMAGLQGAGHLGVWVPTARLRHYVAAERLTRRYLWRYYHGHGRTCVRTDGFPPGRLLGGVPRWLWSRYARSLGRSMLERLLGRPAWVGSYQRAAQARGMIAECRALRERRGCAGKSLEEDSQCTLRS
jgi:glycosyltransferase involved in cell wall biosynthesis